MALPETNISTTLVRNILGSSSNKVSELCKYVTVNMWSKRKPVRDTRIEVPLSDVGKGDGNYGLIIPSIANAADAAGSNWSYERPNGGALAPYRLGDFRGYEHSAFIPVSFGKNTNDAINVGETSIIYFMPMLTAEDSLTNIYFGALQLLADKYLACEAENSSGQKAVGTSTVTIGNGGGVIEINFNQAPFNGLAWKTGTLTFRLFITDVQKGFFSPDVQRNNWCLPQLLGVHDVVHTRLISNTPPVSGIQCTFTKIRRSAVYAWEDIVSFSQTGGDTGLNTPNGDCELLVEFSSKDGSSYSISGGSWEFRTNPTLHGADWRAPLLNGYLRNLSNTGISVLNVPSTGSVEAIIGGDFLKRNQDGVVMPVPNDVQIYTQFGVYDGSSHIGSIPAGIYT